MKTLFPVVFSVFLSIALTGCDSAAENQQGKQMRSQLTIYVAPPLLEKGGTVIVVSNSVPLDKWRDLPQGDNPARDDPQNDKKKEIGPGDRLFGAVASTKVSIIEFVYPEGGTFGFNLVPLRKATGDDAVGPALMTKRVLVGDGGYKDWETGKEYLWESVSTIYVAGPEASEGDSRGASFAESKIMNLHPHKTSYEGTTVYAPTDEQLDQVLPK
ncbi:hypothetical protein GOZ89_17850 [Agrobacterium vitis]|uniref:Lipoprotein n=1 Tax=Agrobacterium vitis TaxID=373 RepID=A0A1S2DQ08_AGRVI|nr:hypothetical protein [Agrobacterium vitis]MCE6073980.1 hypothetical protein [Agrobacterium vitis]MCM2450520.1 hypothetical protein [Agrobacterium vitis]MCM2468811.1 hypothetical protein [Agrobacterium vitis]MUO71474.1 hypothetical protein [Agrobacterium vitis]MUO86136.1 hypothetical protein [Agrobacterium vitis]